MRWDKHFSLQRVRFESTLQICPYLAAIKLFYNARCITVWNNTSHAPVRLECRRACRSSWAYANISVSQFIFIMITTLKHKPTTNKNEDKSLATSNNLCVIISPWAELEWADLIVERKQSNVDLTWAAQSGRRWPEHTTIWVDHCIAGHVPGRIVVSAIYNHRRGFTCMMHALD